MLKGMALVLMVALGLLSRIDPLHAHPHVFIDAHVSFQFNEGEMEGFWVEWDFDPLFTSMIVMDFGAPREGPFSQEVIRVIHDGAFSNLRHYGYFTYVIVDDRVHPTEEVREFSAFMRNRRVVYRFFVPFRQPLDGRSRTVKVRMYDNTFFTDIAFRTSNPVAVKGPVDLEAEHRVVRNEGLTIRYDARDQAVRREGAVYTGVTHPWEAHVQYRRP